jgi:hypothetical protein
MNTTRPVFERDPRKVWAKVEKKLDKMTPRQRAETLVSAGILDKDLNYREPYKEAFAQFP